MDIDALWRKYKATHQEEDRNAIILHYLPTVRKVAQAMAYSLPASVDVDDLNSYGLFGLLDAIEKFDLARGFKFETYAVQRIKGAIVDALRALDWVPRSVRSRARILESAMSEDPMRSTDTAANRLGWTDKEVRDTLVNVSSGNIVSLEGVLVPDDGSTRPTGFAADFHHFIAGANEAEDYIAIESIVVEVADAIGHLPPREEVIVGLYYHENLTLAEIGVLLGITESRVCQIHTKVCYTVRQELLG